MSPFPALIPRYDWREIRDVVPGSRGTWLRFTNGSGALWPASDRDYEHRLALARQARQSGYPLAIRFSSDDIITDIAPAEMTRVITFHGSGEVFDILAPASGWPTGVLGVQRRPAPELGVYLLWHQRDYWVPGHHPYAGGIGRALAEAVSTRRPVFATLDYDTVLVLNLMLVPDRILEAVEADNRAMTDEERRAATRAWARGQLDEIDRPHVNRPEGGKH